MSALSFPLQVVKIGVVAVRGSPQWDLIFVMVAPSTLLHTRCNQIQLRLLARLDRMGHISKTKFPLMGPNPLSLATYMSFYLVAHVSLSDSVEIKGI